MYELSEKDKNHPENEKLTHNEDFKGPCEHRKCTDIFFLLLIICCWVAMTFVGFVVCGVIPDSRLEAGNPARLINGIDYEGQICGVDSNVKEKSKIYYLPDVSSGTTPGVCVDSCPTETDETQFICSYSINTTFDSNNPVDVAMGLAYVSSGDCMIHLETTDMFGYCIYSGILEVNITSYSTELDDNWFDNFTSDLCTAVWVIFGFGVGVALVMGFCYLFLLRIPGVLFLLTWGIIALIFIMILVGGLLCLNVSQTWENENPTSHTSTEIQGLRIFGYILIAVAVLFALVILFMRKRIQLALKITKQASKAVAAMKLLMVWPVIQTISVLCFLIPWIIYVLYLASSGTVETYTLPSGLQAKNFVYDDNIRYAGLYLLFSWFWTSQFIIAMGQIVVAMAIAKWYFTLQKNEIGSGTVLQAIRQSLFYHMGTAAYGSLIIAIIKTIRAIISYLQKKAKNSGNKILQIVLCVIQCCMWCIEKCMKFLNKNAYIQTAIYGYSFCKAARRAFFLIARNIVRIAAVSMVGSFVLFIGKILIPVATTFLAYITMAYSMSDELHGLYGPCIIVFLMSYFVTLMFVEVFGMAISTCLMCFIADEEMGGHFANGDIAKAVDETAKDAAKKGVLAGKQVAPEAEMP